MPGNHEYYNAPSGYPRAAGYWAYFNGGTLADPLPNGVAGPTGKGWYQRRLGSWRLLALNAQCEYLGTSGCGRGSPQYQWLQERLASGGARCTLAYWHQPLFTNGAHDGDPAVRPLWRLLERFHADVVLTGHNHSYERFPKLDADGNTDPSGIRSFVVGAGGKNLYPLGRNPGPQSQASDSTTFGVLKLTLKPDSYTWDYVPAQFARNGSFRDAGSTNCHA